MRFRIGCGAADLRRRLPWRPAALEQTAFRTRAQAECAMSGRGGRVVILSEQRERRTDGPVFVIAHRTSLIIQNEGLRICGLRAITRIARRAGRTMLHAALRRLPPDSFAMAERPYENVLWAATFSGDVALAQQARGDFQRVLVAHGKTVDRPAAEVLADGLVSLAAGRFEEALTKTNEADRLNDPCTECVAALRFISQDKLNRPDSAISAGEAFLKVRRAAASFNENEALFRPAVLQRLGELYEAKGQSEKALARYQAFVDLWHGADPDLQPRVRDVRSRIARLQAAAAKKG